MAGGSTQRCRALFGIMKAQWQFLARPITLMGLEDIGRRVYCCLILHNMNVTDRVMGDVKTKYKANYSVARETVPRPAAGTVQLVGPDEKQAQVGIANADELTRHFVTALATEAQRIANHDRLHDAAENGRLMNALIDYVHVHNNIYN
mmetsp:Transcript_48655/g.117660  ORF Transcript_48655/g.117660 Transcript_48655/m.117660 type:complete len:148 (+) Transcript_48655:1072-1515(+)